jgi:hypothetical protein
VSAEVDRGVIATVLALLGPLADADNPDLLAELLATLGWTPDGIALVHASELADFAADIASGLEGLEALLEQDEIGLEDLAEGFEPLVVAVVALIASISTRPVAPPAPADALEKLAEDLGAFLLESYIATTVPKVGVLLGLLGVWKAAEQVEIADQTGVVYRQARSGRTLDLSAFGDAFRDPLDYLRQRVEGPIGVRLAADAIADLLGPEVVDLLQMAGATAGYGVAAAVSGLTSAERDAADRFLLVDSSFPVASGVAGGSLRIVIGLSDDTAGEGLGLLVGSRGQIALQLQRKFGVLKLVLSGTEAPLLITGKGIRLGSSGDSPVGFSIEAGYASTPGQEPAVRFGSAVQTHFQVGSIAMTVRVAEDGNNVDVGGTIDIEDILLALRGGDGDGFLDHILPKDPIELNATLGLDVSLKGGVRVRGSGGFEQHITIEKAIGPLVIHEVQIAAHFAETGLTASLSGTLGLALGPVAATVESMGLAARLAPAKSAQVNVPPAGLLGPLDFALAFKPPAGAGLSIKAGPVTGGGYLFFDPDNEQYAGVLQLGFKAISITAIGLITTRLPDSSGAVGATKKGFSLLVIIAVEFPPIQLGYGFALTGVGGLLGINRTMMIEPLRSGVRDGSVNSILFPQDVIARAPQIISQLQSIFPPTEGRYVFGPMVKIGWGPKSVLEFEAALVLELMSPIRLVILGRVQAALPDKKDPVLKIRLDMVGVVDFDKGEISVDASLIDSRLVMFSLTGDMALRVGWGASKIFVLAAGGFHPHFQPPPGFPVLKRLAIALADSDNPRLRMETYLALTSNTIQFGAALDAYAKLDTFVGTFSVSANLAFDALIQFQPLELTASLGAQVDIARNGVPFLHAALLATLTGPTPWHIIGYAEFDCLGKHRVDFEATVGPPAAPPTTFMDAKDVLTVLATAFSQPDAWVSLPPDTSDRIVSLRDQDPTAAVLVHPLGALTARQRLVPLGTSLERFGAAVVTPTTFALSAFSVGSGAMTPQESDLFDAFSPGQFKALTDDERVTRPAFELMRSGGHAAVNSFRLPTDLPAGVATTTDYAESIIDVEPETGIRSATGVAWKAAVLPDGVVGALSAGGAAAFAGIRGTGPARFRGPRLGVTVAPERYVVAATDTLHPIAPAASESSAEAHDRLMLRPRSAPAAQVVPTREAA